MRIEAVLPEGNLHFKILTDIASGYPQALEDLGSNISFLPSNMALLLQSINWGVIAILRLII